MTKLLTSLFLVLFGLAAFTGVSVAEEANADKQDIIATCTAESSGAIDAKEYIDECVKEKEEELKEMAKESKSSKPKS